MVSKPAIALPDDLLALFSRAEVASAQARTLLDENDRWRQSVLAQLEYMFELGAEFRKPRRSRSPAETLPPAAAAIRTRP
jgi:hypothetical protein